MKQFSKVVVAISMFQGANAKPDKNGEMPVYLKPIAGKLPSTLSVLSGTMAKVNNLELGKSYGLQIEEYEESDAAVVNGKISLVNPETNQPWRQFTITNLGEQSLAQTMEFEKLVGEPKLVNTNEVVAETIPASSGATGGLN